MEGSGLKPGRIGLRVTAIPLEKTRGSIRVNVYQVNWRRRPKTSTATGYRPANHEFVRHQFGLRRERDTFLDGMADAVHRLLTDFLRGLPDRREGRIH